jgi:hypothetical protein
VSASLGWIARHSSIPEKMIKATAQPANRMTTMAKPIVKKRSENLVTDMKLFSEVLDAQKAQGDVALQR